MTVLYLYCLIGRCAGFNHGIDSTFAFGRKATRSFCRETPGLSLKVTDRPEFEDSSGRKGNGVFNAFAALLLGTILAAPVQIDVEIDHSKSIPVPLVTVQPSRASALTEGQLLVADVWKEVTRQYVDTTYNGLQEEGWRQKRLDAVKKVANAGPDDKEEIYEAIRVMLKALNDPYTRFLTPAQFDSLTVYATGQSRGNTAGIGVQLIVDPASGKVVVVNSVSGGPAEKGGILSGDVIEEVDGVDVTTSTAEVVAAKLRGEINTFVNVAVRRGGPDGVLDHQLRLKSITREQTKVNPVQLSVITAAKKNIGLLQVRAFSQETPAQIVDALRKAQEAKVSAIAIDLRGNAGGYMPAGVDVAKMFLPAQTRIISEVDKSEKKTVYVADGIGSETQLPLYLLVDKRTASASEILTAALQDNERAIVVGEKTFGKGRIQNVQPLADGGVAVTKAKYITPNGRDIHGVGIMPNKVSDKCQPNDSAEDCLASIL